jgi:hypothetical protein
MPETPEIPEELPFADEAAVVAEAAASLPEGEAAVSQKMCGGTPTSQNRDVGHPVEVAETAKENEPMIDIHVPQATHTWKDFWIHLGTITAGLLIAISLEQSVEALHHLHQRHELEASLRVEGEMNKKRAEANFARYDDEMTWMLGLHEDIGKMMATGGKANLPYREIHETPLVLDGSPYYGRPLAMMTAVWDTADADNRLALLRDEVAHGYSLLYHIRGERFAVLRALAADAMDRQAAFEALFADISTPKTPVLARMSAADLKQYDALAMQSFTAMGAAKEQLRLVYASNEAMLQGLYDSASTYRLQIEVRTSFADDYGKMAREVAAEDAARDKAAGKPAEKGAR